MTRPWEETWSVVVSDDGTEVYGIRSEYSRYDCDVVRTDAGYYPPKLEAARLIAAAPDLYRALETLLRVETPSDLVDHVFPIAEAAMKKARGE